jgi:hypothetical protein
MISKLIHSFHQYKEEILINPSSSHNINNNNYSNNNKFLNIHHNPIDKNRCNRRTRALPTDLLYQNNKIQ